MAVSKSAQEQQKKRQAELTNWFTGLLPALGEAPAAVSLTPLSGDASFRRYFTSRPGATTYVLVDAPPDKEDSHAFVQIARSFLAAGVNVPVVFEADYARGFMCLSYLGDTLLWEQLDALKRDNRLTEVYTVYRRCFEILLHIQGVREGGDILLPPFDAAMLHREMDLFREWFCGGIMGLDLADDDHELLDAGFEKLVDSALGQPQVCVHRDYHSRNLVYREDGEFGVLDFQDAVIGPLTYDLVSLVKDCYISWPKSMIRDWALQYANMAQTAGIIDRFDDQDFLRAFDLMGVQRHLKAVGIFSRLYLRDGKAGYLGDIPRTLAYIKEVLGDYPDFYPLGHWLEKQVYPMLWTRLKGIINRGGHP